MTKLLTYTTFFLLPIYLIKIPIGNIGSMNLLDFLLLTSIVSQAIFVKTKYSLEEVSSFLKLHKLILTVILFLICFFFLSLLLNATSDTFFDGLGLLKSYLFLPVVFALGTSFLVWRKTIDHNHLLLAVFFGATFQSILGYLYTIRGLFTYDSRLAIFYESPNQFAMILAIGIIIGIHFLLVSKSTKTPLSQTIRAILIIAVLSLAFSLLLTHSLGSWIALAVSIILVIITKANIFSIRKSLVIIILAVFTASFLIYFMPFFARTTDYKSSIPPSQKDSRIMIYSVSQKMIKDNLLFGIGMGNFQKKYLDMQIHFSPYPQWAVPHAHNNLLHVCVEGGIFALFCFSILIFISFRKKINKPLCGLFVVLVYLLVHGIVDVTFWKNDLSVIWWSFLLILSLNNCSD